MSNYLPNAQAIHYKPRRSVYPEGGDVPKLVENNMTNQPMRP